MPALLVSLASLPEVAEAAETRSLAHERDVLAAALSDASSALDLASDDRVTVFEGNARRVYPRLNPPER